MAGTAWVEPTSGRVLRTALDYTLTKDAYATRAQITVTYVEDRRLNLLVPSTMTETYEGTRAQQPIGRLATEARYSAYRRFSVEVSEDAVPTTDR